MMTLGPLGFAAPAVLAAVAALPVIWLLLRVTPPAARTQSFPPLRLLRDLVAREETTARTPLWLLLLRLLAAFLVILGLAHPLLNPQQSMTSDRPLLLVVDDGWDAAAAWEDRRQAMLDLLDRVGRQDRPVQVLTTAAPADGSPLRLSPLGTAEAASDRIRALIPKSWPADHAAALAALGDSAAVARADSVWVGSGLAQDQTAALLDALQRRGSLTIITPPPGREPVALLPPERTADGLSLTLVRPEATALPARDLAVHAIDTEGRTVASVPLILPTGETAVTVPLVLPGDLRNGLARLEAWSPGPAHAAGAAAVRLLDDAWRRRPVGVATSDDDSAGLPLLADSYYVRRALAVTADVRAGDLAALLNQKLSLMILPGGPVPDSGRPELERWVRAGGGLVRFAGPDLAARAVRSGEDVLLPVGLRAGGRTLGGVLSWTDPAGLAPFPDDSPFAGLTVPADVTVRSQMLAEPNEDLGRKTWARLADGTPLVTGARLDRGWVVLVHTTADADWTNLPLSGLFPQMLERLVRLGEGLDESAMAGPLPPLAMLDGLGRLNDPSAAVRSLPATGIPPATLPGPAQPPGWYGNQTTRRAINLPGETLIGAPHMVVPPAAIQMSLGADQPERDLRGDLLSAALALLLLDLLISFLLRGLGPRLRASLPGMVAVAGLVLLAPPGHAADSTLDARLLDATLSTRLAFVQTGIASVDQISEAGLTSLTQALGNRTSAELASPTGIDIDTDTLTPFPLLYWPAAPLQRLPGGEAKARVQDYLRHGGMIVFDGRGPENADALRTLLQALEIPPLMQLPKDHVLTRSFYLLTGLPGRLDGAPVWIERGAADGDGVSSVVIGSADWAGAWARDARDRPLLPVPAGGERGREMTYRAGINIVMYALTGNYKDDQVHLPAIMERLTQ